MEIEVVRIAVCEDILPSRMKIPYEGLPQVGLFLEYLVQQYGPRLREAIWEADQLSQSLVVLLNGKNLRSLPRGLETELCHGDSLVISIPLMGG
ncbi:MAG: hypothetical protein KQI62_02745 [Deltaproteobacteria bacterium]|nr:hypothetical protein [Deltaproteobacteria bacterium]